MNTLNKKIIAGTVAATLVLTAGFTFAKGSGDEQRDPSQRFEYIFTQLDISETDQAQVIEVMEGVMEMQRDAMWAVKQDLRDREERPTKEEMQSIRETQKASMLQQMTDQLNTVLSPEVTEEFVEYLEAHSHMAMHGKRGGKGGFKGDDRR